VSLILNSPTEGVMGKAGVRRCLKLEDVLEMGGNSPFSTLAGRRAIEAGGGAQDVPLLEQLEDESVVALETFICLCRKLGNETIVELEVDPVTGALDNEWCFTWQDALDMRSCCSQRGPGYDLQLDNAFMHRMVTLGLFELRHGSLDEVLGDDDDEPVEADSLNTDERDTDLVLDEDDVVGPDVIVQVTVYGRRLFNYLENHGAVRL